MKLIIVHYHLRPGGIRRIIELATPHLVRQYGGEIERVVLASGESAQPHWAEAFAKNLGATTVEWFVNPVFRYTSEQRVVGSWAEKVREGVDQLLDGPGAALVWAHNLGIARNLVLTRELIRGCVQRSIPVVAHHHDWWFDNRWLRWPEMRRHGVRTLATAARVIFPPVGGVQHVAINQADASVLGHTMPRHAGWLPNLMERTPPLSARKLRAARHWLRAKLATTDPVWILPCRLLRRKNVGEALLITRWLRPGAWLVTTGDVSSSDERAYASALDRAGQRHRWHLRLGILRDHEKGQPTVEALLGASEAVLLTSIQEGFGLPYLEAAAAQRPLIARQLPNISPDLAKFGFRFPQSYDEVLVDLRLFDGDAEEQRQKKLFRQWTRLMPRRVRRFVGEPIFLRERAKGAVPFSRLSLTAQLEILSRPAEESWELCGPFNPCLALWKERAAQGKLGVTAWPAEAGPWLSGPAYAQQFQALVQAIPQSGPPASAAFAVQDEFLQLKLASEHLYPLLWSIRS